MSYHILHIFNHGSVLKKNRGLLVCESPHNPSRKIPIDDVRAIIVAAKGVTITSQVFSTLLANDHLDFALQRQLDTIPEVTQLKTA